MATIPDIRTDRLSSICESSTRSVIETRGLSLAIDEPADRGGTNTAMSPTETFMASLAGCVNVVLGNAARREAVDLQVVAVDLEYDFDTRGVRGLQDVAVPFREVRLRVTIRSDAGAEALERAREAYNRACPVTRMIRAAGCEIKEEWSIISG